MENSLQASKVYDNVLSNNENSSKFNLLHAIDITPKLNFHQLNGYTRPSTLGGILSVLVLLSIIPSIIIFGYDFYNKSNPLIVVKKLDLTIDQLKENYWSKVNIPFSFVYSKNYELSNEGPNFKILKDAEFNIPYKCSNDEIMYYYNTQPQSGLNYYCSAVTLNSTHITEDYKLELKRFNLKNTSFTNNEKELYIVGSSAKFKKLNYSRTDDYLNEITISKTESDIKIGKVLRSNYYYTLVNFYDDQNSIIPKYNRTTFENYVNVLYNKDQDEFAFNARDIQVFNIYRTYRKLPEVLAVIIALVANLKIFLGIIHNTIQNYEHLKHLSKLYSKDNSDYDYVDKIVKFRYFLLNIVCPFSFTNNMSEYKKFTSKVMMAFSVSTQISIWNKTLFKPENDIAAQIIQVNNKLDNSHVELVNRIEFKLKNSDLQV